MKTFLLILFFGGMMVYNILKANAKKKEQQSVASDQDSDESFENETTDFDSDYILSQLMGGSPNRQATVSDTKYSDEILDSPVSSIDKPESSLDIIMSETEKLKSVEFEDTSSHFENLDSYENDDFDENDEFSFDLRQAVIFSTVLQRVEY